MVAINQIRDEYRLEAEARGVQQTVAAAERLASATNAVGAASDNQTRKTISVERALERFAAANDRAYKAEQALARGQSLVTRAQEQGLAGTEAYERALASLAAQQSRLIALNGQAANSNDKVAAGFQRMAAVGQAQGKAFQEQEKLNAQFRAFSAQGAAQARALGVVEAAHTKNARATALHAQEWQNLGFQANDAVTMLASGSSVFQVLATQGGQVYQILQGGRGGVGGSLKEIGSTLAGLMTPARLAGGALAIVATTAVAAAASWESSEARIKQALAGSGRAAGATVGDIEEIARQVADASDRSIGSARDLTLELAKTGKIGRTSLAPIATIGKDFAKTLGLDAVEGNELLARSFAEPGKGALELAQKYQLLDDDTAQYIRRIEENNDRTRAQQVLLDALRPKLTNAAELTTGWAFAWEKVKNAASGAYGAIEQAVDRAQGGQAGRSDTELRTDLERQIRTLRANRSQTSLSTAGIDKMIVEAERKLAALDAKAAKVKADADDAARSDLSLRAGLIARATAPELQAYDDLISRRKQLADSIADPSIKKNVGETAVALARLDKQIADFREAGGALELQEKKLAEASRIRIDAQKAKTPAEVGEIARRTSLNNALGTATLQSKALADADRARAEATAEAQAQIDSESRALDRSVQSSNIVADSWRASGEAAAMRGEAARKAAEDVARGLPADQAAARTQQYLREQIASWRKEKAQQIAQMGVETAVEQKLNRAVDDGRMIREQANNQRQRELEVARLTAQAAAAEGDERAALLQQVNDLTAAYQNQEDARATASAQGMLADQKRQVDLLALEASLLGKSTAERERALAVMRAQQELDRQGISDPATRQRYISGEILRADLTSAKQEYERFAQEIASVVSGIFDDLFTRAADGSKDLMENMARSISRIGSRLVEQNLIIPMLSGQPGALGSMNFSGLIDTKAIGDSVGDAIKSVMPPSIQDSFAPLLKPRTNAAGQNMGVMSSPLMGGLAAAGVGGAIGYSSQSPLMGALGGGLAGLATGNPIMGIVGAGAGLLGGLFGKSEAKKAARRAMMEQLKAYAEALAEARPQIEQMSAVFRGEGVGSVEQSVTEALSRAKDAIETASKGGDQELANRLMREFPAYVARLRQNFADAFTGTLRSMRGGEGLDNTFSAAAAAATQLGESLKGFVSDAERLGAGATRNATRAARQAALDSLEPPKALTDVQERLREIQGTGTALRQVLIDLGMSAKDAAEAIRDRTKRAFDELRESFQQDVRSRLNDVRGLGYLNDITDLVAERGDLRTSARELGLPMRDVERYFAAAMQKIVDEAELSGKAFDRLIKRFPELRGRIDEFGKGMQTAAERAEEAARIVGYRDRVFMAGLDTSTLNGQLKAFDRQALRERQALEQAEASRREIRELERAQHAERLKLIHEYQDAEREARQEAIKQARDDYRSWARDIRQYLTDLVAGPDSPLSPGDRLTAAQSQFEQQLFLARAGDQTALSGITGVADSLLAAARENFASSPQFQAIFNQVTEALRLLPAQVSPADFMVDAIVNMRDVLKGAIELNSPTAIAVALTENFDRLDTTMNGKLSSQEFLAGLGPLATKQEQTLAKEVFDRLDKNGNGQLEKQELIRAASVSARDHVGVVRTSLSPGGPAVGRLDQIQAQSTNTASRLTSAGALYGRMEEVRKAAASTATGVGDVKTNTGASDNNATKKSVDAAKGVLDGIRSLNETQRDTLRLLNGQYAYTTQRPYGVTLDNNLLTALNKIVFNTANTVLAVKANEGNKYTGFGTYAAGGYTGPGGRFDVAGLVHRREYVMPMEAVNRLGLPMLDALRAGGTPAAPLPMPIPMAAPIANDNAVTNGLLREIASLIKRVGEMEARIDKAGFEKVVEAVEEVADAVRSGNDRRQSGTQTAGRGAPVRPGKAA